MKKIIYIIITLLIFIPSAVLAEDSINVGTTSLEIEKGNNATTKLYINTEQDVSSVSFSMITTTYDANPIFIVNDDLTVNQNNNKYTINFIESKTGRIDLGTVKVNVKDNSKLGNVGNINIHTISLILNDESIIKLNNISILVKVFGEEQQVIEEKSNNNKLKEIQSKITSIKLNDNTYKYTLEVENDITELDLVAIPEDDKATVNISSQKLDKEKENKIIITVKAENNEEKIYEIIVNKKTDKQEEVNIQIDDSSFIKDSSYKGKAIIVIVVLVIILLASILLSKKK